MSGRQNVEEGKELVYGQSITDQQNQLDELREEIRLLNLRIASVAEASNTSEEKEHPPPHY